MKPADALDLKVVVLGSAYVGKTSIINRYCNGVFSEETRSTIGAGFFTHTLTVSSTEVTVMLWDTAGEERFRSVAPSLLRGANGLVLAFDLTTRQTFKDIDIYMDLFLDTCKVDPNLSPPVLLLGNKCDLPDSAEQVTSDEVTKWADKNRVQMYYPVSAKDGTNVEEAMTTFIQSLVSPERYDTTPPIPIVPWDEPKEKPCC
jgi:small GTP-binding protein